MFCRLDSWNCVRRKLMERVKFYSNNDLSLYFYMDRMKNVMENIQSINHPNFLDILEFYNIKKFLKNGIYPKGFPEGKIKKYKVA